MKEFTETEWLVPHNHYRVYYKQNSKSEEECLQADQQFLDIAQSAVKMGWFVEIRKSERYFGPEIHARKHNPYITDIVDQSKPLK